MLTSFWSQSCQGQLEPHFHTEAWLHVAELQNGVLVYKGTLVFCFYVLFITIRLLGRRSACNHPRFLYSEE